MKPGTSFLLGVLVGMGTAMVIKRVRIVLEEDKPDRVLHSLNDSLDELERRAKSLEARISHN